MQSSSLVNALRYRCQWKRAKALLANNTKMSYWRNWTNYYQKRSLVSGPNMSDFYMPIRLQLLLFIFFTKREGNSFTISSLFTRPCSLWPPFVFLRNYRRYRSRQALWSDAYQCFTSIPKSAYREEFRKWIHRLKLLWGHEINKFVITKVFNVPAKNKQFVSNTLCRYVPKTVNTFML